MLGVDVLRRVLINQSYTVGAGGGNSKADRGSWGEWVGHVGGADGSWGRECVGVL